MIDQIFISNSAVIADTQTIIGRCQRHHTQQKYQKKTFRDFNFKFEKQFQAVK